LLFVIIIIYYILYIIIEHSKVGNFN